jgi:uncharacterized protein
LTRDGTTARLTVLLIPRGGRDAVVGFATDAAGATLLRVRVAAPPVEGRANAALERLLATALDVPPSRVRVVAGHTSRRKQVEVEGITLDDLVPRLSRQLAEAVRRGRPLMLSLSCISQPPRSLSP